MKTILMPSDSELLRQYLQDASQHAFTELVGRHIDFVYATALRQAGNDSRAKDVTQSVFADLARKAPKLASRDNLVGWLHTSTRYAAASLRRSETRREAREETAVKMDEILSAPSDTVNWEKLSPILDEALTALKECDRDALLLRFFKQCSFGEIGTALGMSDDAARKRIDRGVDKLRGVLAKRGITSTIAALELAMAGQSAVAAPVGFTSSVVTSAITAAATATTSSLTLMVPLMKIAASIAIITAVFVSGAFLGKLSTASQTSAIAPSPQNNQLQSFSHQRDALRKRLETVREANAEQQRLLALLKRQLADKIQQISPKLKGDRFVDFILGSSEDPDIQKLLTELWRYLAVSEFSYDRLFAKLNFSDAQISSFLDLELNHAPLTLHHKFTNIDDGHGSYNFAFSRQTGSTDNPEMREFLGDAAFKEFEANNKIRTINVLVVDRLAANLIYTDSPLTSSTAEKLAAAIMTAAENPDQPDPLSADWDKILKQSRAYLTPTQWSALARLSGNLSESYSLEF